jgi:hypothetical protein
VIGRFSSVFARGACFATTRVKMTSLLVRIVLLFFVVLISSRALSAETIPEDRRRHIRTTDPRLIRLVRDGVRTSETLRRLVDRLNRSDVVVYLDCGGSTASSDGRLTFISAVGGYRYVHVRVARLAAADVQTALIGHELQHAVEIADAPDVVDSPSLVREYQRIGFLSPRLTPGVSFDSDAAVDAGQRVLRELSGKESRQPPALSEHANARY